VPNSLVAGKNAGIFADSPFFRESVSRKHPRIQQFAAEFAKRPSRELIRASRESDLPSREFGSKSIRAPQTPNCVETIFVMDNKIINNEPAIK
jgi:hypothetical protein